MPPDITLPPICDRPSRRLGRTLFGGLCYRRNGSRRFTGTRSCCVTLTCDIHGSLVGGHVHATGACTRSGTGTICCLSTRFLVKQRLNGKLVGLNLRRAVHRALTSVKLSLSRLLRQRTRPNLNGNNLKQLTTYFVSSLAALGLPTVNCNVHCRFNVFARVVRGKRRRRRPSG